jgi:hypothetical protein
VRDQGAQQRHRALAQRCRFGFPKQHFGAGIEPERAECVDRRHRRSGNHSELFCNNFGLDSRPLAQAGSLLMPS